MSIREYLVMLGNIEGDFGVIKRLSAVIAKKLAEPTSSIFVLVAGSKKMASA